MFWPVFILLFCVIRAEISLKNMYNLYKELENKVVIITGGAGYIGSSLINELRKYSVKKIIRTSRKIQKPLKGVEDWNLDLNFLSSWLRIVEESDIIFHLSGNTSIPVAENDPEGILASEISPITNLVRASKELFQTPRVIYASTATVYGLTEELPVSESYVPVPITSYDIHKLQVEKQLEIASQENIINAISLRLANVYGPSSSESSSSDRGILSKITKLCFENKTISLYGSGSYVRDYVYIDDVVNAFLLAGIVNYDEIYKVSEFSLNVSSEKGTYVKKAFDLIAQEVKKFTGVNSNIKNTSWPSRASEIEKRNFIGSSERLKSMTNWTAQTSVEDGVQSLVRYHSKEYR